MECEKVHFAQVGGGIDGQQISPIQLTGERRQVTALLNDIVGSTEPMSHSDTEDFVRGEPPPVVVQTSKISVFRAVSETLVLTGLSPAAITDLATSVWGQLRKSTCEPTDWAISDRAVVGDPNHRSCFRGHIKGARLADVRVG